MYAACMLLLNRIKHEFKIDIQDKSHCPLPPAANQQEPQVPDQAHVEATSSPSYSDNNKTETKLVPHEHGYSIYE